MNTQEKEKCSRKVGGGKEGVGNEGEFGIWNLEFGNWKFGLRDVGKLKVES
jgi:hypothetical protein